MVRIRYFAWLREAVGFSQEDLDLPADVRTGADLIAFLRRHHPHAAEPLSRPALRIAVDQRVAQMSDPLGSAREIALFPPMTGG